MAANALYLGIDLGTTNSTAALFDGEKITLVRNPQGSFLTPSVVRIDSRGAVTVGDRARRFADQDPDNTRSEFKRLMGTAQKIVFPASKTARLPEELAAEVVRSLRADVRQQLGFEPAQAIISVPALFELPQSSATVRAAELAGFEKVELIQEPVASAIAAGWKASEETGKWLVYDLGGGTFDVSLLETREGMLRVVGHDGDNFLGGRDLDLAIVDWALQGFRQTAGVSLSRSDPRHAAAIRKIKVAAEEAKIELSRSDQATLFVADVASSPLELTLDRETLERLLRPLIDRSLSVCRRLLETSAVAPETLSRVVLVGGPTVTPLLRRRVREELGAPLAEEIDPMTVVAQGAAIYAATARLEAQPAESLPTGAFARRLWLQYPAMSSDLTPHVVGRLAEGGEGPRPVSLRLVRADGLWSGPDVAFDAGGGFVASVELLARKPNTFRLEARNDAGELTPIEPSTLTIFQGLTVTDPPLARSIGVALADDSVREVFRRGTPLPARRTVVMHTVQAVAPRSPESVVRVPIVQGEFDTAHLCRLVGTLEISGRELSTTLPARSAVELTLEVDRGGRLSANAHVPALSCVFSEVAHLVVPEANPEALNASIQALRQRTADLRTGAFGRNDKKLLVELSGVDEQLEAATREVAAFLAGDADSGQKARRNLLELDAQIASVETAQSWPDVEAAIADDFGWASSWVSGYGTEEEQRHLAQAARSLERARAARDPADVKRLLRLVVNLGNAAFFRHPDAWSWLFEHASARVSEASDIPEATALIKTGRAAVERGDARGLRQAVEKLWRLLPADAEMRRLSFDSGVW
jgi:molecular chaperone DnaK